MAYRLAILVAFFAAPFIIYAFYRLAVADARSDGRNPWPIHMLAALGAVAGLASWFLLIFLEQSGPEKCVSAARFEDGRVIRSQPVECVQELERIGLPDSEDPGGQSRGVSEPGPAPLPAQ